MGVVVLQGLFYSIQTKFQASVFSALSCPLDHPPRNQQEQSALFQPDGRSVASGVREQAERLTRGADFRYPGVVAHQARRMPLVRVAEGSQLFVVAAPERVACSNTSPCFHGSAVE